MNLGAMERARMKIRKVIVKQGVAGGTMLGTCLVKHQKLAPMRRARQMQALVSRGLLRRGVCDVCGKCVTGGVRDVAGANGCA